MTEIGLSVQKLGFFTPVVTKWSPSGHQVVTKWSPSGHQGVTKWSPRGHHVVTIWSPSGILVLDGLGIQWLSMVFNGIQISDGLGWSRLVLDGLSGLSESVSVDLDCHRMV